MSLPSGWALTTLGELAASEPNSLVIGPFGSNLKVSDYTNEGVPLVFVREIRREQFGVEGTRFVSHKKADELRVHAVRAGDLLVTKMGDPPGDTSIYPVGRPNGIITADCIKMTPDTNLTSSVYLRLAIRSADVRARLLEETRGVAQQKLSLARFRGVEIELPPFFEQRRIVAKLDALLTRVRKARESLDRLPAMLETMRQSVLAAAFRGDLTKEWREAHPDVEPAEKLLERIRIERRRRWEESLRAKGKDPAKAKYVEPKSGDATELPELPEGWVWVALEQIATFASGGTPSRSRPDFFGGDIPWVKTGELLDGDVTSAEEHLTQVGLENSSAKIFPPNTLLVAMYGATIGRVGWLRMNAATNQACAALITQGSPDWIVDYLFWFLRSRREELRALGQGGAQPNISQEILRRVPCPLPPESEALRIVRLCTNAAEAVASGLTQMKSAGGRLDSLEQSLLAKAFRGELVSQDPSDEPASVLLERIRAERAAEEKPRRGRKVADGARAARRAR